jgi:hypothetical protein
MGSMMSGGSHATGAPAAADVQSGAIGAKGIQGGYSTPTYSWLSPQANATLSQARGMSFEDWLKTLGQAAGGVPRQSQDAGAGMSAFQNPQAAPTQHQIGIGTILSMLGGAG